ncbi:cation:proton antiporter [Sphingobacterium deserti]|uniref:Na+/H+-exchanging protein n=1 Tax=Sphingobacterium deserti TaxID=1229276 RepID=A0A0B8T3R9_9SPHI|nr:cation:proton antiporter [Sphingobacterium deserti]KGE15871.1 Na+/H+-exchanging protein [Sphingobacterium deserti]
MRKFRNAIFYVGIIGGFSLLMYWIILNGVKLEDGKDINIPQSENSQWSDFLTALIHNIQHPLAILLAQIVTIILVARLFSWICVKIKQPAVIGEMIAGIVLGPSLIGMYFPEFSAALFPQESLGNLQFLSQIGLILFMYIVGMEIDMKILKHKAHDAVVISHASIIMPFVMGLGLAYFLYDEFAPANVQFLSFGLFAGIAMSITAFPVLARIVQERGINKTRLGTIVITCAAADDITAWCILAAVIAIVKAGSFGSAAYTILLAILYVILMIRVVRPFLLRIGELNGSKESLSKSIVAIFFLVLILSAYATEVIGIHALFGAFIAGAIMPDNIKFRNIFIEKVEDVALVLLLPLFFVFTGLRTQIGLLNEPYLWKIAALIFAVAVVGKFVSSALAAKFVGQNWRDSLAIGALMNTRGLTELVALNIGYDLGVLTPELFSMMVIMALATTFMTGPTLDFIDWLFRRKKGNTTTQSLSEHFKVLISFSNPESGRALFRLAHNFSKKESENTQITAMHIVDSDKLHHYDTDQLEREKFEVLFEESKVLNREITTMFKTASDIDAEIIDVVNNEERFDMLLVGLGQSIYKGTLLGNVLGFTTRLINPEKLMNTVTGKEQLFQKHTFDDGLTQIVSKVKIPVAILINRNFKSAGRILIPVFGTQDQHLLSYAGRLIRCNDSEIELLLMKPQLRQGSLGEAIQKLEIDFPNNLTTSERAAANFPLENKYDLVLTSTASWKSGWEQEERQEVVKTSILIITNPLKRVGS